MNVFDYFFETSKNLDKDFVLGNKETISYKDLYGNALKIAYFLKEKIGENQHILLVGENSVFFITAYLGILKSGNVCVPLNFAIEQENLDFILNTTETTTVIVSKGLLSKLQFGNSRPIIDEEVMNEIHFRVNRDLAQKNGISPMEIAQTVGIALMGRRVSRFQTGDNEIDVRMQLKESDRANLFQLLNLQIFTPDGRAIPLRTLVTYQVVPGPGAIQRIDGKIHHTIQVELTERDMVKARKIIEKALEDMKLPAGYSWDPGQAFFDFDLSLQQTGQAFLLASILVLLLLGALFESLLHPFTIFFSLPFALVGAFWALRLTGSELNITGNIGLIILVGIVVNNAIVLVDHINQLRASGMSRRDALLQAGEDRFRPIIMTAGTTILGLAPMAMASRNFSARMYSSLAITVMGGLITSTILTLLVLPVGYALMDNLQQTLVRWFHSFQIASGESSSEKLQNS